MVSIQDIIQGIISRRGDNACLPRRRLFALPRFGANMNEVGMPRNGAPALLERGRFFR
jgi:hypothetical protein